MKRLLLGILVGVLAAISCSASAGTPHRATTVNTATTSTTDICAGDFGSVDHVNAMAKTAYYTWAQYNFADRPGGGNLYLGNHPWSGLGDGQQTWIHVAVASVQAACQP